MASVLAFEIAPGRLSDALTLWAKTSGLKILAPTDKIKHVQTTGATGRLTAADALHQLLSGTELDYRMTNERHVTIFDPKVVLNAHAQAAGTLPTVEVTETKPNDARDLPPAYAGGQVASGAGLGILGNRGVMDAPFNVTSYTAKTIKDQQARTVADIVQNDPSVRNTWADGGYSNQFFIRGFPLGASEIAIGGLYGIVPYQLAGTAFVERVEILKGPGAFLNGMAPLGGVGGTINLVPKRAPNDPLTSLALGYISNSQFGTALDVARRFGDNKEWGVRANGAYTNGDTPVQNQTSELGQASLAVDYAGERFRFSADLNYQKIHSDDPTRPVYFNTGFPIPSAPKNTSSLGQPWYFADGQDTFGMVKAEVDVTDDVTVFASAGGRHNNFLGVYSFLTITDALGNASGRQYVQPTYADAMTAQGGVRAKLTTGAVRHEFTLSATGLTSEMGVLAPSTTFSTNIYNNPVLPEPNLSSFATTAPKTNQTDLASYSLSDSMYMFDDRVQLTVGGRYQKVNIANYAAATGALSSLYDEGAVTPFVGAVVKPWQNVSLYANYIEGLTSGGIAPVTATNAGTALPPAKSKQIESGVKVDFGRFTTTVGVFEITQPLAITQNGTYMLGGEQRNRGVDVNVFGEVQPGLRMLGGVTFMEGTQTKTLNGATNGKEAVGVPDVQVNLGAEWDTPFIPNFTLTGRVIYTAAQVANAANTQTIPEWTRVDLGARYVYYRENGKPVTLRASVENVFDESYWSAVSANYGLARGAPRTYLLSATFDF
ncbi:TonB-dependent siderophore receptor [Bradyrhizobium sp. SYSU BS000235]|uniref:TonB-dependent siderophore receptor n=1 Tax=Bradyrhizobium sp. SYSU BS000235 TaxID=3411332 RepID=UPI003C7866F9